MSYIRNWLIHIYPCDFINIKCTRKLHRKKYAYAYLISLFWYVLCSLSVWFFFGWVSMCRRQFHIYIQKILKPFFCHSFTRSLSLYCSMTHRSCEHGVFLVNQRPHDVIPTTNYMLLTYVLFAVCFHVVFFSRSALIDPLLFKIPNPNERTLNFVLIFLFSSTTQTKNII